MSRLIRCDACGKERNSKTLEEIFSWRTLYDDDSERKIDICPECITKIKEDLKSRKAVEFDPDYLGPTYGLIDAIFGE